MIQFYLSICNSANGKLYICVDRHIVCEETYADTLWCCLSVLLAALAPALVELYMRLQIVHAAHSPKVDHIWPHYAM